MINPSHGEAPLDLTTELISIKKRLEALEQRLYTIDQRPVEDARRLGPPRTSASPYDLSRIKIKRKL